MPNNKLPDSQAPNNKRPAFKLRERQPAGSINRDMQMRDRGNNRNNNFNQSANKMPAKPVDDGGTKPAGSKGRGVFKRGN